MFNRIIITLCICLCATITIDAQRRLVDKVVAVVGDEPLYFSDINATLAYAKAQGETIDERKKCLFFEQGLTEKLLINQAAVDSVIVTNQEVKQQVNARINQILTAMGNDTSVFNNYYGKKVTQVRSEMTSQMRNQLVKQRMQGAVLSRVNVTPSEVKTYFEDNQESLPYYNAEVEIAEVVILPKPNAIQKQLTYNALAEIRTKVIAGEATFEDMATEYSQDPGSAKKGGDLGLVARGTFVPEFEGAAFNLEIGEYSDIIETDFGYHFLQLLERRGNLLRVRHILRIPPIHAEDEEKVREKLKEVKGFLESDSITLRDAVAKYTDDIIPSKSTAGYVMNQKTGNTRIEVGDLDFDIFFTIDSMEVGQISKPIEFKDLAGSKGYKIIKLISRKEAHKASVEKDYYKIKELTLQSKKDEYLSNWVAETIENTYLHVDQEYKTCENVQTWVNSAKTNLSYDQ